ncbi:MAG: Dabb family protein [Kiritimatiellae bacterium]|nr:Dabb family protein [Kiritimatiellia bacterium]
MIKHIVIWKLSGAQEDVCRKANAIKMRKLLEELNGRIPGLVNLEVGFDFSETDASGDIALYSEFVSREALAAYQTHPDHLAAASFVKSVACDRRIIDYEV